MVNNKIETKNIAQIIKSQFNDEIPEFLHNCNVAKNVIAPASDEAPKNVNLKLLVKPRMKLKNRHQIKDNTKFTQQKLLLQMQLRQQKFE